MSSTRFGSKIIISQYYCALYIGFGVKPLHNYCYCSSYKNRFFFYTKGLPLISFLIYIDINQRWIEPQLNWSRGAVCNASQAAEEKEKMLNCSCGSPVNPSYKLLHQSPRKLQWSESSLMSVARSSKSSCNAQDK